MTYSVEDLNECLEREISRRLNEYPLLVATNKMSVTDAQDEIGMMQQIKSMLQPTEGTADNALYNKCMGLYRNFHQQQIGLAPNLIGKAAKTSSNAMRDIINYLRANSKTKDDDGVMKSWEYLLGKWSTLSEFHRRQVALPDIQRNLSNILYELKNGANKQSTTAIQADEHERSLEQRRHAASAGTNS